MNGKDEDLIAVADRFIFGRQPQDTFAVVSEFAFGADITVEGDTLDPQFLAQIGNGRVALGHGRLGETHLRLGKGEFSAALAPSRAGSGETWTCNGFVPVTYLTMPPWPRMRGG